MALYSHMLKDVVTVAPQTGVNDHGDPSYGTQTDIAARIEENHNITSVSEAGDQVNFQEVFWTHGKVEEGYFIWLPGADTSNISEARRAKQVKKMDNTAYTDTFYRVAVQ